MQIETLVMPQPANIIKSTPRDSGVAICANMIMANDVTRVVFGPVWNYRALFGTQNQSDGFFSEFMLTGMRVL